MSDSFRIHQVSLKVFLPQIQVLLILSLTSFPMKSKRIVMYRECRKSDLMENCPQREILQMSQLKVFVR